MCRCWFPLSILTKQFLPFLGKVRMGDNPQGETKTISTHLIPPSKGRMFYLVIAHLLRNLMILFFLFFHHQSYHQQALLELYCFDTDNTGTYPRAGRMCSLCTAKTPNPCHLILCVQCHKHSPTKLTLKNEYFYHVHTYIYMSLTLLLANLFQSKPSFRLQIRSFFSPLVRSRGLGDVYKRQMLDKQI